MKDRINDLSVIKSDLSIIHLINSYKIKELKQILQDSYQGPFDVYIGFCDHIHVLIQIYE